MGFLRQCVYGAAIGDAMIVSMLKEALSED